MVRVRVELTTLALSASCSADYGRIALDELEINFFWIFHLINHSKYEIFIILF